MTPEDQERKRWYLEGVNAADGERREIPKTRCAACVGAIVLLQHMRQQTNERWLDVSIEHED